MQDSTDSATVAISAGTQKSTHFAAGVSHAVVVKEWSGKNLLVKAPPRIHIQYRTYGRYWIYIPSYERKIPFSDEGNSLPPSE